MVALQIRDVPDEVRDALASQARVRGMSLQALLLELVTDHAWRAHNLVVLDRFEHRRRGARLSADELRAVLVEARTGREGGPRQK